ncbi:hypothetical protein CcrBL47_gp506 [Caulobacter phage BL47]|nr:hypothetical protein CcrBL47_gp506 [Caulobacter phage BL47]UTU10346.1 hypothetical protein CcrRB23_gp484 [Caulobacter phage RB23]
MPAPVIYACNMIWTILGWVLGISIVVLMFATSNGRTCE